MTIIPRSLSSNIAPLSGWRFMRSKQGVVDLDQPRSIGASCIRLSNIAITWAQVAKR